MKKVFIIQHFGSDSEEYALSYEDAKAYLENKGYIEEQSYSEESNEAGTFIMPESFLFQAAKVRVISRNIIGGLTNV
jgi:hypothetical protein